MRVVHRKAVSQDEDCIGCNSCGGYDLQIGPRKQNVGVGDHRAERIVFHHHRLAHLRTVRPPVMNDGRGLRGEMERGTGADDKIKRQPVCGVESAGRRLKIQRREIGPHPVELEWTGDVEGISDMLAAEHGSSAGEFGDQQNFRAAAGVKP